MRRADREITDQAHIDAIIRRGRYVTIALIDGSEPYAVPLSYGFDEVARRLYFHVAHEGRKLRAIAANPRACGSIVIDHGYRVGACEHPFESVVVFGTMRVVSDPDEKRHAILTLVRHLEPDPEAYWESRSWRLEERIDGFTALCLDIESASAKRGS